MPDLAFEAAYDETAGYDAASRSSTRPRAVCSRSGRPGGLSVQPSAPETATARLQRRRTPRRDGAGRRSRPFRLGNEFARIIVELGRRNRWAPGYWHGLKWSAFCAHLEATFDLPADGSRPSGLRRFGPPAASEQRETPFDGDVDPLEELWEQS
jgi:hypothetical protein